LNSTVIKEIRKGLRKGKKVRHSLHRDFGSIKALGNLGFFEKSAGGGEGLEIHVQKESGIREDVVPGVSRGDSHVL